MLLLIIFRFLMYRIVSFKDLLVCWMKYRLLLVYPEYLNNLVRLISKRTPYMSALTGLSYPPQNFLFLNLVVVLCSSHASSELITNSAFGLFSLLKAVSDFTLHGVCLRYVPPVFDLQVCNIKKCLFVLIF